MLRTARSRYVCVSWLCLSSTFKKCFSRPERRLKATLIVEQSNSSTNFTSTIQNPCQPLGNSTKEKDDTVFGPYCTRDFSPPTSNETTYTFNGTSETEACAVQVGKLFNKSSCSDPKCSFDGIPEPALYGSYMVGVSNLFKFSFEFGIWVQFSKKVEKWWNVC